ncbi:hypothetical protein FRC11_002377, partial [Ceratobasidium sp. 423]
MHGIDKMNGEEDYPNWSFSIQQAAMDVRIDGHLTDSIPQLDQVNTEDHIDWKEECSALTGGIFSSIAGWQQAECGGSSKKKHKAKDANVAEVKDLDDQLDSIEGNTASIPTSSIDLSGDGGLDVFNDFMGGFTATISNHLITLGSDTAEDYASGPTLVDVSSRLEATVAADSHLEEFFLDTGAQGIGGTIIQGEYKGDIMLPVVNNGQ